VLALSSYVTPADARDIVYCSTLNTGDGTDYSTLMPSLTQEIGKSDIFLSDQHVPKQWIML
jgi:hypothetical protein